MKFLSEVPQDYNPYFNKYLDKLEVTKTFIEHLEYNLKELSSFFNSIQDKKMTYSYGLGKWSVAQVIQHIIDTERIFCYRTLKINREKDAKIVRYDHDKYAENSSFLSKENLIDEYLTNRQSTIGLFKNLGENELLKFANYENYKLYAGLIPFIICGHELHHIEVLKSKYLID